jgi:hypothetical protein
MGPIAYPRITLLGWSELMEWPDTIDLVELLGIGNVMDSIYSGFHAITSAGMKTF